MNIANLTPQVEHEVSFSGRELLSVPDEAGCYVLTNFSGEIFYIGRSENLSRRMAQHLGNPKMRQKIAGSKATQFHYRLCEVKELPYLERGWMNEYRMNNGGRLPPFNKVDAAI